MKLILHLEEFTSVFNQSDDTILEKLYVIPWSQEQYSYVLASLYHFFENKTEYITETDEEMLEFIAKSQSVQWLWSSLDPKAIHYFMYNEEIIHAILQKLEMILCLDKFATFCKLSGYDNIFQNLSLTQSTHVQISTIVELLSSIVQKKSNQDSKLIQETVIAMYESKDVNHKWDDLNYETLHYLKNGLLFEAALTKLKTVVNQNEFTLFCKLSDYESILGKMLAKPKPFSLRRHLAWQHHTVPKQSEFSTDTKDRMIDFFANSNEVLSMWIISNPETIYHFSKDAEILSTVLKKMNSVGWEKEFAQFCLQSDCETMVNILLDEPCSEEQISTILDILQYTILKPHQFKTEEKKKLLEFITSSQDSKWKWIKSNLTGMNFFSDDSEIFGAVLQKVQKILRKDQFATICKRVMDYETFLEKLSVTSWNTHDISLILDILYHVVPKRAKFSPKARKNMLEFIGSSESNQWTWIKSNPTAIIYFSLEVEVLAMIVEKALTNYGIPLQKLDSIFEKYLDGNLTLHCLSKDPLSENQMSLIMYILHQANVKPEAKNSNGQNFLELSPILPKLVQQIQTAPDDWTCKFFEACATNAGKLI